MFLISLPLYDGCKFLCEYEECTAISCSTSVVTSKSESDQEYLDVQTWYGRDCEPNAKAKVMSKHRMFFILNKGDVPTTFFVCPLLDRDIDLPPLPYEAASSCRSSMGRLRQ